MKLVKQASKPLASISLDLDNQWSYMKIHGDPGWEKFPSYLDIFIPRVLEVLDRLNLKITFFVVGQDAALDKNREALSLLTKSGHEVGNHSFHHEPWLHLYSKEQIKREILDAEEQIIRATGQKPIGFRGPGFSWTPNLIEVLAENGYLYDATTFPTYIGPLARMYYFSKSNFKEEEKNKRGELFGSFKDGFRPIKPYYWKSNSNGRLLEIPITTIPFIKTPFHLTYLLYLSRFSFGLLSFYLKVALTLCRLTRTGLSFLLHPLDLLDGRQVPELDFFPGMDLGAHHKANLLKRVLKEITKHFTLVNMGIHAQAILGKKAVDNGYIFRTDPTLSKE